MGTSAVYNILSQSEIADTFVINANGTDLNISIQFINDRIQMKSVTKANFSKLVFESIYTSPFAMGQLQLIETDQQNKLRPAIGNQIQHSNYDVSTGTGGEFIHIHIQDGHNSTLLQKTFIVKNILESKTGATPMLNYYFADVEFGSLSYTRLPWSTNNMLKGDISNLNNEQRQVSVSDAISNLITTFCDIDKNKQTSINTEKWDDSISKTEYTLHRNQSPLTALSDLMSKYVSKKHKDTGILYRHAGKFKLLSLTNIFKYESIPSAAIKIEINDTRTPYTRNLGIFAYDGLPKTPVNISNVQFYPKKPDTAVDVIVDHSISSYNTKNKKFKLYNNPGSVTFLKQTFDDIISYCPYADTREANVDKSAITTANKNQRSIYENSNNSEFLGKVTLQSKLIHSADRVSFTIPGNLFSTGGKFIAIDLSGIPVNQFMRNVPGLWFVLQNTTTITARGRFDTFLVSAKLDRETYSKV